MSASHANIEHPGLQKENHSAAPDIAAILDRGGVFINHTTTSKKRLLEQIANLFADRLTQADASQIFSTLFERENLGSTGIGSGVALPHGRITGLTDVIGLFIRLEDALDFDAADHLPVKLIFAILVPEDATDEHLQLLSHLAGIFRDSSKREQLLSLMDLSDIQKIFSSADE
jgi:PTS system nitrogen regulatory IIA component